MLKRLYYDPSEASSYSTVRKLEAASAKRGGAKDVVRDWLLRQDAYTLHKPVRKRFPRNPYTVNNIDDVWELDLVDLATLSQHNDGYKYLLNAIDTFSKYAYSQPLRSKTGKAVTSAFQAILVSSSRPLCVHTDKGKEFLNSAIQQLLKAENIEFRVCRNPDVKCAVIERWNRTLKTKMYKYFTGKNTYRYIDVLDKFVEGYNNTVHSTTGMPPALVSARDVLKIWQRMQARTVAAAAPRKAIYKVGQTVRISKEKMHFAKGFEQNYSVEIFRVLKVVHKRPRPVYELEDLRGTPIEGQFYSEELTPVKFGRRREYQIDKIIRSRVRGGIRGHLVRWKGYPPSFDSWISASSVRQLR